MDELATLIESILAASSEDARGEALALVDLDATEAAIRATADQMLASGDTTDATVDALAGMADALDAIAAERTRREEAAASEASKLAGLTARFHGEADVPAEVDTAAAADAPATDVTDPAALAADAPVAEVEAPVEAPAPAAPPSLAALRSFTPAEQQAAPVEEAPAQTVRITAALDVPNHPVGASFASMRDAAQAIIARTELLGKMSGGMVDMERIPVVHFDYLDDLNQLSDDKVRNGLLLREAAAPNALTASGGFCAPAETIYDFVKINNPSGLTQDFLPVVGAPRGSIEFPDSPDIRDAFSATVSRSYSNAQDIAGTAKITAVIACPSFNTCTVGAQYVILQFGNFGTRAYPEWVEHWVGLSMDAHAHKVSEKLIFQMVGASSAAVAVGPNGGATASLISNLAMAAADFRHDLKMGAEATLEVVLPTWTHDLVRSDLARARKGGLETLQVSNAQIDGWIKALNLNPHYVTDWQDVSASATTGTSVWPSGLQFLIYPPGTFVKLDMGTLDLGVVRDSTLNATNDYNIFVETFESVCMVGIESRLYSVSICANGSFSADQNLSCAGTDIPGS